MSAHSSNVLADALAAEGFKCLAARARKHEFHDFLSPHALPQNQLVAELCEFHTDTAERLKLRVIDGEFDATLEEADQWAASPEGKSIMAKLGPSSRAPETGIEDENHALLLGHVLGALLRLTADTGTPTTVEPVTVGPGIYSNRVKVERPSGEYVVTVTKSDGTEPAKA